MGGTGSFNNWTNSFESFHRSHCRLCWSPNRISHTTTIRTYIHTSTRATDEIAIRDNLHDFSELAIARALLKHSVEFILPPHYKPDVTGEMRVVVWMLWNWSSSKLYWLYKIYLRSLSKTPLHKYIAQVSNPTVVSVKAQISVYSLPSNIHALTLNLCVTLQSANCTLQMSLALW